MAKGLDRICQKYDVKLGLGQMSCRVDRDQGAQMERFRAAVTMMEELRKAVAAVLCRFGISTIWWPYYYDFALWLAAALRRGLPEEFQREEARLRLALWVSRGLVREALEAIALECLELDLSGTSQGLAESGKPG